MQVNGVPNKYEIYQDYYLQVNGKEISYAEALRLFSKMDNEERTDFEQYYKDETGYEIVDANGYYFGENAQYTESGTKKVKKHWKIQTGDGSFGGRATEATEKDVKIYTTNSKKAYIDMKYTIEGYAKEKGIILDPVWSQYSAEEIMRMKNNGVNIPQEIVDIANTILETSAVNYETNGTEEETADSTDTTEKEPFLELIPKAEKKIEKCNETNEKINDKINEIIPETEKQEKNITEQLKKQQASLNEYENIIKEWKKLQDKLNNGEALTDTENKRYSELSKTLGDQKGNDSDNFEIDKNEIAKSLNEINILAVLGEKLGEETVEISDTLADYTSETNYKTTYKTVAQSVGFLKTIISLAQGKAIANDANEVGHNTLEYTNETNQSVNNIASVLGIENSITNKEDILGGNTEISEANTEEDTAENTENNTTTSEENSQKEEENIQKEYRLITDAYVKSLIDEGKDINSDLYKQINIALSQKRQANKDSKTSLKMDKVVTKLVEEFNEEEELRQKEIENKEKENEEAKKQLQELTGKSPKEIDEELANNNNNNKKEEGYEKYYDDSTKEDIKKYKQIIIDNNKDIQAINQESIKAKEQFKEDTAKESKYITNALSIENNALEINNAYQEKELPEHNKRMDYINSTGATLAQMGAAQILVGGRLTQIGQALLSTVFTMQQGIALIVLGSLTIVKGTASVGIGIKACQVSDDESLIEKAEKTTDEAGTNINKAIGDVNIVNDKIVSVTGEDANSQEAGSETTNENSANNQTNQNNETQNTENNQTPNTTTKTTETIETTEVSETSEPANDTESTNLDNTINTVSTVSKEAGQEVQNAAFSNTKALPTTKNADPENAANNETNLEKSVSSATLTNGTSPSSSSSTQEEEDTDGTTEAKEADNSQDEVDNINSSAKDDSKESKQVKKDTEKDKKQLEKEAKQLQKQIKKDEEEIIKMTQESTEAAKKQEEALVEYETLVTENETLIAEETANQQTLTPNQNNNTNLGTSNAAMVNTTGGQGGNSDRINNNGLRINELSVEFNLQGNVINRNRTKITRLQKSTTTNQKRFDKKIKVINNKVKEEEKAEQQKQKRLAKQLGAVGIAENVFSITTSTGIILNKVGTAMIASGTAMLSNPFTAAAGAALISSGTPIQTTGVTLTTVGTYGTVACGVTKSAINIANGNLAAGLMSLGQTAISAVTSLSGTQGAVSSTLSAVSAGLNIVSSSAEMVNNVRAVQGKEQSGLASKIGTIAGAASAITNSAASLTEMGKSGASKLGKSFKIAGAAGTALTTSSELMTEFGGDSKAANILGMVGGAISTVSALGMVADKKFNNATEKNKENQEKTEQLQNQTEETQNNTKQTNETETKTNTDAEIEKELKNTTPETIQEAQNETVNPPAPVEEKPTKLTDLIETDITVLNEDAKVKMAELSSQISQQQQQIVEKQIRKENRKETLSNATNALAGAANVAGSLFTKSDDQQQQQKRKAPAGKLTERTKEIMKKNKKRIAALAGKGYNI